MCWGGGGGGGGGGGLLAALSKLHLITNYRHVLFYNTTTFIDVLLLINTHMFRYVFNCI